MRGGGHGVTGSAVAQGGLMIDLSPMKDIIVDPGARVAHVQPGVTWGELDAATQEHGLAITGGRVSNTGVAGLTLGSGSGWLERTFGLTCDDLRSVTLVTADGATVRAAADENAELFWGLKGGGGNFGIVTEFEFTLHPVGPIVAGGLLLFALDDAARCCAATATSWRPRRTRSAAGRPCCRPRRRPSSRPASWGSPPSGSSRSTPVSSKRDSPRSRRCGRSGPSSPMRSGRSPTPRSTR